MRAGVAVDDPRSVDEFAAGTVVLDDQSAAVSALEQLGELLAGAFKKSPSTDTGASARPDRRGEPTCGAWLVDVLIDCHLRATLAAVEGDPETTAIVHRVAEVLAADRDVLASGTKLRR